MANRVGVATQGWWLLYGYYVSSSYSSIIVVKRGLSWRKLGIPLSARILGMQRSMVC